MIKFITGMGLSRFAVLDRALRRVLLWLEGGWMSVRGCLIRDAEPGLDDDVVAALMVDYLTLGDRPAASEYGVDDPS